MNAAEIYTDVSANGVTQTILFSANSKQKITSKSCETDFQDRSVTDLFLESQ